MQPSRKLWYSREDKNIAIKKLKESKCRTLRRSADRNMVCTACFYFREEYMERTKFEIEHAMAQNAAVSPGCQEICGSKSNCLGFDTKHKPVNNGTKAVETAAWMKLLGLIR